MNVPVKPTINYAVDIFVRGDFSKFTPEQEAQYLRELCASLDLNPHSRPIEFINLNGRRVPYVKRDGTDQLRKRDGVSVIELTETERDGVFIVTAKVQNRDGRTDVAKGAVNISGAKGEVLANLLMKAETKAKRRATLSICGLGFLDETEVDETPAKATQPMPDRHAVSVSKATGLVGSSPKIERADAAWRDKIENWMLEVDAIPTWAELEKWTKAHSVEAGSIPERLKDLQQTIFRKVRLRGIELRKLESLADQVVHEEDGERPATPEDFNEETGELTEHAHI